MERVRVAPINGIQKDTLIEFMQRHEDLLSGRFTKDFTFKKAEELWQEIGSKLNVVPGGAKKEWRQWRKTWQDLKKNVKTKLVKEKKYLNRTGGGPENKTNFNPIENSILNMMSPFTTNVAIPQTEFQFENVSSNSSDLEELNCNSIVYIQQEENANSCVDEQLESVEIQDEDDHKINNTYTLKHVATSTSTNQKCKCVNQTGRLENSLKISQGLVRVEEEKNKILESYYKEKINYLQNKNLYEKEKLACLHKANELQREANEIQTNILNALVKANTKCK